MSDLTISYYLFYLGMGVLNYFVFRDFLTKATASLPQVPVFMVCTVHWPFIMVLLYMDLGDD